MFGKKIAYYFFRVFVAFYRIVPFKLLYLFSDITYLLLYHLIGYRKSVVRTNLNRAFPEKSQEEKRKIERKFYKNLTDIILEAIKANTAGKKELLKRFKVENPELLDKYIKQNQNVIMAIGHIGNWETAIASVVENFTHKPLVFYKPLSNKYIDQYLYKNRSRFGVRMLSIHETAFHFDEKHKNPVAFYMVADQYSPRSNSKKAVFFGKESVFLRGIEVYAQKYNLPVIYWDIKKTKRGHYSSKLSVLTEQAAQLPENELTQKYANALEKTIRNQPETWMWSHKRWKNENIY